MRKLLNEELGRPTLEACATLAKLPIVVVLDNVRSAQNVGSFFRTADAFGIERIALCGISSTPPNREIHKTALGSELSVAWSYHATTMECVEALRANKADFAVREKLNAFRRFVNMLVTDGWIAKDAPIKKAIDGQKAPPKPKAPNLRDL